MQSNNEQKDIPQNIAIQLFTLTSTTSLRYAVAKPRKNVTIQGTIFITPDYNDKVEFYFNIMKKLANKGFYVFTIDWCPVFFPSDKIYKEPTIPPFNFKDYKHIFWSFLTQVVGFNKHQPLYLIAHGLGATVALNFIQYLEKYVKRCIMIAPWLKDLEKLTNFSNIYKLYKNKYTSSLEFFNNKYTSDQSNYQYNVFVNQDIYLRQVKSDTYLSFVYLAWQLTKINVTDKKTKLPILFVMCGKDNIVSNNSIYQLSKEIRSSSILRIENAQHDIIQESPEILEEFMIALQQFLPGGAIQAEESPSMIYKLKN